MRICACPYENTRMCHVSMHMHMCVLHTVRLKPCLHRELEYVCMHSVYSLYSSNGPMHPFFYVYAPIRRFEYAYTPIPCRDMASVYVYVHMHECVYSCICVITFVYALRIRKCVCESACVVMHISECVRLKAPVSQRTPSLWFASAQVTQSGATDQWCTRGGQWGGPRRSLPGDTGMGRV